MQLHLSLPFYQIDSQTDIAVNETAQLVGGLVSSRDYVDLRHWSKNNDAIIASGVSSMITRT